MIFNSITFLVFFVLFFILYWFLFKNNLKLQNLLILAGSYFFYAWADWRLLSYLIVVSTLNYFLGIYIEKSKIYQQRKLLIYFGLFQGIGGLLFFKYFNFFISSFNDVFRSLNADVNLQTLNIIIPLGISFFTFKTISYILDIEKGKIEATKDWVVFFNYVSFFPTILSGPIDKARDFIPQLKKKRVFDYNHVVDGMRQILWGLFKKVVIADSCAEVANAIFNNSDDFSGSTLVLGALYFSFQLYADFSGYSDMAIGFSRILGFKVTKNFDFPFFSQNIAEFWRKWHISLTSWLTEYVFTPLSISFRDYGKTGLILAIVINFTLVGLWHGANWTYVLFGFIHGCAFVPLILRGTMNKNKKFNKNKLLPSANEFLYILLTFIFVTLTLIIFRAKNMGHAINYIYDMFSMTLFSMPGFKKPIVITFIIFLILIEWFGKEQEYALEKIGSTWNKPLRWVFYYSLAMLIILFSGQKEQFIYFQF